MPPLPPADDTSTAPTSFRIPQTLLTPHSQPQESLHTNYNLLHLLHHRNKNQYRRSLWYRHFNRFRRETAKLCLDLHIELSSGAAAASRDRRLRQPKQTKKPTQKQKQDAARRAATQRLTAWVDAGLVDRWYTAFTTLLATPSSSPLALTLLGILARVCDITGLTTHIQRNAGIEQGVKARGLAAENEMATLGEALGEIQELKVLRDDPDNEITESRAHGDDDLGIAIARDEATIGDFGTVSVKDGVAKETAATRPKKKRKRGNAIDDLFAELL